MGQKERDPFELEREADRAVVLSSLVVGLIHELNNAMQALTLNAPLMGELWRDLRPAVEDAMQRAPERSVGLPPTQLGEEFSRMIAQTETAAAALRSTLGHIESLDLMKGRSEDATLDINEVITCAVTLVQRQLHRSFRTVEVSLDPATPRAALRRSQAAQVIAGLVVAACARSEGPQGIVRIETVAERAVRLRLEHSGTPVTADPTWSAPFPDCAQAVRGVRVARQILEGAGGCLEVETLPSGHERFDATLPVPEP